MKIIFTNTFKKKLLKMWNLVELDIISLVKKYPNTNNLIIIDTIKTSKILKWYLLSKKIRILILFEYVKNTFIPISIIKKESYRWENIIKNNYIELFWNDIDKTINEYDNNMYIETEI